MTELSPNPIPPSLPPAAQPKASGGILVGVLIVVVVLLVGMAGIAWFVVDRLAQGQSPETRESADAQRLRMEMELLRQELKQKETPATATSESGVITLLSVLPDSVTQEDRKWEWYSVGGEAFALVGIVYAPGFGSSSAHFKIAGRSNVEYISLSGFLPLRHRVQVRSVHPKSVVIGLGQQEIVLHWRSNDSLFDLENTSSLRKGTNVANGDRELPKDPSQSNIQDVIKSIREREAKAKEAAETATPTDEEEDETLMVFDREAVTWESFVREIKLNFAGDILMNTRFDDITKQALGIEIKGFRPRPVIEGSSAKLPVEIESYGIEVGDIIFSINDVLISTRAELVDAMEKADFSREFVIDFERKGVEYRLVVQKAE